MNLTNFFKRRIEDKDYPDLRKNLRKIRVSRSTHDYVARAILYSLALGIIVSVALFFVFFLLLDIYPPYSVGLSAGAGAGLGFVVYYIFLSFPRMKATNREKEIEDMLPHATAYMLALSKGGFEPIEIFDSLGKQEEYGEIAREAAAISRNAKILGYSPTEAIKDVAETTPSQEFEDFLSSLSSVIETGSSIPDFLQRRSERYYREAEEKQEENLEFLGVMAEVYVVGLGLGPIFAIILLVLFGMMGNFMTNLLYLIVYLFIPLGTSIFIILLDMQSRTRFGESGGGGEGESSEESFLGSINRRINHSKDRLKNIRTLLDYPMNVLWFSVPAGVAVSAGLFFGLGVQIETLVTFFALVSLTPLAVLFELKRRREERMIEITPDFLNSFSDALSSGLSPSKAFFSLSPERYGELESEIEKIRKDIEWGSSVSEAFRRSAVRLKGGIVSRIMSLVKRSSEVASEISGILNVLATDVTTERSLHQERRRVTIAYVIIVFLSFGIFLLTAYSISTSIIPLMVRMTEAKAGAAGQSVTQISGIDPSIIKQVFLRASLIQGFFSGLLAGMMQTGRLSSGLKYSMIMIAVAWGFFTIFGF